MKMVWRKESKVSGSLGTFGRWAVDRTVFARTRAEKGETRWFQGRTKRV